MKTIRSKCQIISFSSKNDGSLRMSIVTATELSIEEKVAFMELQGLQLEALFVPEEYQTDEMVIDKDFRRKEPITEDQKYIIRMVEEVRGKKERLKTILAYGIAIKQRV